MSKIIGRPLYAPAPAGGGASPQLPELAGTWVMNERLYAPENWTTENVAFTATNTAGTTYSVKKVHLTNSSSSGKILELDLKAIYYFMTNAWATGQMNNKYNKWTFPAGATASDEFRAWLESNATKQTA